MTQSAENYPCRTKIQQLLASIGSKQPNESRNIEAVDYDWHLPHFFNSRQTKKLAIFTAKAATLIAEKFGVLCQRSFEVTITSTSEHFAGQFLSQDPGVKAQGPTNYYLPFSAGREEPCGFVSIPPQTAVVWATQLLGDTESKENATRALSSLEATFLFDMASLVIAAISGAGEKCDFRPAADVMMDHLPLQLKGTEEFLKITFGVKKSGSESPSEAHILVFCEKIAPAIGEPSQIAGQLSEKDASAAIQNHIEKIAVPVIAQLACVPVTVEQVINLAVGDILLLDKKIDEPAQLLVAGRTLCRGRCAKSAGCYAIVVTETFFETT
jgi:flagellar motor switch protein FliM